LYFYDSYAIIEYIKNNSLVFDYFEKSEGVLTILNVMEVYYIVLKDYNKEFAEMVYEKIIDLVIVPSNEEVKEAMQFKLNNQKKKLSYADVLGYIISKERNILFLTGDKEFKNLDNVQFIHKS